MASNQAGLGIAPPRTKFSTRSNNSLPFCNAILLPFLYLPILLRRLAFFSPFFLSFFSFFCLRCNCLKAPAPLKCPDTGQTEVSWGLSSQEHGRGIRRRCAGILV